VRVSLVARLGASDYRRRRNGISEMRSATRMRQLRHVLPPSPKSLLHENIARLAVLYEDLRIELTAASASLIRKLDRVDSRYRRNYFLRKCIGTIVEFAEAIRFLDGSPEFKVIKSNFSTDILKYWTEGVKFVRKHERFLKSVRNDIGGHFGTNAAKYAVLNLDTETIGKIELIDIGGPKARIHLYFAGEIAALASLRHLVKGADSLAEICQSSEIARSLLSAFDPMRTLHYRLLSVATRRSLRLSTQPSLSSIALSLRATHGVGYFRGRSPLTLLCV
jgi:hypothetical protein